MLNTQGRPRAWQFIFALPMGGSTSRATQRIVAAFALKDAVAYIDREMPGSQVSEIKNLGYCDFADFPIDVRLPISANKLKSVRPERRPKRTTTRPVKRVPAKRAK